MAAAERLGSWATVFEEAGFTALTPGWPDDPVTVEEANAHPEVFVHKTVGQVADHYDEIIRGLTKGCVPAGSAANAAPAHVQSGTLVAAMHGGRLAAVPKRRVSRVSAEFPAVEPGWPARGLTEPPGLYGQVAFQVEAARSTARATSKIEKRKCRVHRSTVLPVVQSGPSARAHRGCRRLREAKARPPLRSCFEDEVERRFGGSSHACESALVQYLGEPRFARLCSQGEPDLLGE